MGFLGQKKKNQAQKKMSIAHEGWICVLSKGVRSVVWWLSDEAWLSMKTLILKVPSFQWGKTNVTKTREKYTFQKCCIQAQEEWDENYGRRKGTKNDLTDNNSVIACSIILIKRRTICISVCCENKSHFVNSSFGL